MISTYIEKKKYYETNRVFIVSKKTDGYVVGRMLNLDTWMTNSTRLTEKEFRRRFEVAPLQMK